MCCTIWVQKRDTFLKIRDLIEKQEAIDIKTFVIETEHVPFDLLGDFIVMDDKMVVKLELTRDGTAKQEHISIDPIEIQKASSQFDLILKHVITSKEYYEKPGD